MYLSWTDDVPIVYPPYTCATGNVQDECLTLMGVHVGGGLATYVHGAVRADRRVHTWAVTMSAPRTDGRGRSVRDRASGHHRVSFAIATGQQMIDADVAEVLTSCPPPAFPAQRLDAQGFPRGNPLIPNGP